MGNASNASEKEGQDPTTNAKLLESDDLYKIYQDDQGMEYEKYLVQNNNNDSNFENQYNFRMQNQSPVLVNVIYAGSIQNSFGCAERSKYSVVTERIPFKLSDLSSIRSENSIIILKNGLEGFGQIFKFHGLMSVKESMIGFNMKHQTKVWLNSNYSLNQPEPIPISLQYLDEKDYESEMINNIFDLINSKTERNQLWAELMFTKEQIKPQSFAQAIILLHNFCDSHHLDLTHQVKDPFNKIHLINASSVSHLNQPFYIDNFQYSINQNPSSNINSTPLINIQTNHQNISTQTNLYSSPPLHHLHRKESAINKLEEISTPVYTEHHQNSFFQSHNPNIKAINLSPFEDQEKHMVNNSLYQADHFRLNSTATSGNIERPLHDKYAYSPVRQISFQSNKLYQPNTNNNLNNTHVPYVVHPIPSSFNQQIFNNPTQQIYSNIASSQQNTLHSQKYRPIKFTHNSPSISMNNPSINHMNNHYNSNYSATFDQAQKVTSTIQNTSSINIKQVSPYSPYFSNQNQREIPQNNFANINYSNPASHLNGTNHQVENVFSEKLPDNVEESKLPEEKHEKGQLSQTIISFQNIKNTLISSKQQNQNQQNEESKEQQVQMHEIVKLEEAELPLNQINSHQSIQISQNNPNQQISEVNEINHSLLQINLPKDQIFPSQANQHQIQSNSQLSSELKNSQLNSSSRKEKDIRNNQVKYKDSQIQTARQQIQISNKEQMNKAQEVAHYFSAALIDTKEIKRDISELQRTELKQVNSIYEVKKSRSPKVISSKGKDLKQRQKHYGAYSSSKNGSIESSRLKKKTLTYKELRQLLNSDPLND